MPRAPCDADSICRDLAARLWKGKLSSAHDDDEALTLTDPWIDGESDPSEEIQAELAAAYGLDWPAELLRNMRFDTDAEPVELPPFGEEIIVVRKVFLRLPMSADRRFKQLGRQQGRTPSEPVSAWIADRLGDEFKR
ncbi:hypothetical protein [Nocardia niigatensis]